MAIKEHHKLTATFLNNIAVGLIAIGALRPIIEANRFDLFDLAEMLVWSAAGIMLHLHARRYIKEMEGTDE